MSSALSPTQTARATVALALANARYWRSVAPRVRAELSRWRGRAEAIPDHRLRRLATGKLREERFNVELAATLATLAPRMHRQSAVEAIVALQVKYDYTDVLAEQPATRALPADPAGDGGYLHELERTVSRALATLPTNVAVAEVARRCAERCRNAQTLGHAASDSHHAEVELWARREAAGTPLHWPEWLAGAQASVLSLHALIAAAADERTTREDAQALDAAYLSIGALTMLDSLIDRERDLASGALSYVELYDNPEQMAERLATVAREATAAATTLPRAAHHTMTLAGIVAFYASDPAAGEPLARPVFERVRRELAPLTAPTLAVMRGWRLAKSVRARIGGGRRVLQLHSGNQG